MVQALGCGSRHLLDLLGWPPGFLPSLCSDGRFSSGMGTVEAAGLAKLGGFAPVPSPHLEIPREKALPRGTGTLLPAGPGHWAPLWPLGVGPRACMVLWARDCSAIQTWPCDGENACP